MLDRKTELAVAVSVGVIAGAVGLLFASRREVPRYKQGRVSLVHLDRKGVSLGEGPIWDWDAQRLLWIDVVKCKVHIHDPRNGSNDKVDLHQMPGTIVPRAGHADQAVVAMHRGVGVVNLTDGTVSHWFGSPAEEATQFDNRFNDGKCDPAGRLWVGTMDLRGATDGGALYCLDTDGSFKLKVGDAKIPNGIVWSKDGSTMFWIDTLDTQFGGYCVQAFDYDLSTGRASNRRKCFDVGTRGTVQ